jgi:hypothetical protein
MTREEETAILQAMALDRMEELCRYLLPCGRKEGRRWKAGSSKGEPGRSFDVNLDTGVFGDWADGGEMSQGGIDLWMVVRQVDFKTARAELAAWLGRPAEHSLSTSADTKRIKPAASKEIVLPRLEQPTKENLRTLSKVRSLEVVALEIAVKRGFLWCFDDEINGRCWLFTDARRKFGSRRRLDGQLFELRNGDKTKAPCCPGSIVTEPLGCQEARGFPSFAVSEGCPDGLAVLDQAWKVAVEDMVAPIVMPSEKSNFTAAHLECLKGKRGRIFVHGDEPGIQAARRWLQQLAGAGIKADAFAFVGLVQVSGQPVKDLNDFCRIAEESRWAHRHEVEGIMDFALEGAIK